MGMHKLTQRGDKIGKSSKTPTGNSGTRRMFLPRCGLSCPELAASHSRWTLRSAIDPPLHRLCPRRANCPSCQSRQLFPGTPRPTSLRHGLPGTELGPAKISADPACSRGSASEEKVHEITISKGQELIRRPHGSRGERAREAMPHGESQGGGRKNEERLVSCPFRATFGRGSRGPKVWSVLQWHGAALWRG